MIKLKQESIYKPLLEILDRLLEALFFFGWMIFIRMNILYIIVDIYTMEATKQKTKKTLNKFSIS